MTHSESDDLRIVVWPKFSPLRTVLHQDRPLSLEEFLFMENHFRVLEMAYLRWKRKHGDIGINDTLKSTPK